jgi:uncharacterized iron-regulated membrane protein
MWVGAATVLYIFVLCLSGSVALFERDLYRLLSPDPALEPAAVPRLSGGELINIALARYPEHGVVGVWDRKVSADVIAEIWLDGRGELHRRLLNPYTGADLGPAQPASLRILATVRQLHTNLIAGTPGRLINGLGSVMLLLLATSAVVSWIFRRVEPPRSPPPKDAISSFHRRVGIWMIPFAALWGLTGIILTGPVLFGDRTVEWAYALHAGVGGGWAAKALLAACALLTSILLLVGAWMWWHKAAKKL